jgi:hypothetical protein
VLKIFDNELYLSPSDASTYLTISSKTLQRWVENGKARAMIQGKQGSRWQNIKVKVAARQTVTGYRYYRVRDILSLLSKLGLAESAEKLQELLS